MPDFAIDIARVDKTFRGKVHALRGIGMQVERGEIYGLLGPNGAGKSTLVKILMTVVKPTRCEGTLLGRPVGHKSTLARVGYLPEHHRFADYLTGAQVIDFYGAMTNIPRRERRRRAGELLELVGMSQWAGRKIRGYSKGMRQRIGIAQALINDPDLVLLDEPTDGVDPVGRRAIRNILVEIKSRGKTVFLNSHLLSELEMVCDRVAILVQGVVAQQGTIDHLTRDQQRYEIEVAAGNGDDIAPAAARVAQALGELVTAPSLPAPPPTPASTPPAPHHPAPADWAGSGTMPDGTLIRIDGRHIRLRTSDAARVQPVLDALRRAGLTIASVRPFRPSLEDLFMQAVTDPSTGRALPPGASDPGAAR
jgi:ABC-2 type transport system ATP-binding protein